MYFDSDVKDQCWGVTSIGFEKEFEPYFNPGKIIYNEEDYIFGDVVYIRAWNETIKTKASHAVIVIDWE